MDGDMQIDSDSTNDVGASGFIFSSPNLIISPDKMVTFGIQSDNIFGGRSSQSSEASFIFAKPTNIENEVIQPTDTSLLFEKSSTIGNVYSKDQSKTLTKSLEKKEIHQSHSFSAEDIKETVAFTQLQKNSKKIQNVKLEASNAIICSEVPDSLIIKSVAKEYFEQFGEVLKITIRPKRKVITVYYSTKKGAVRALNEAGSFLGHKFATQWLSLGVLSKPKKKESIKGRITSILNLDDEVKEELEAMKGLEYNLPDSQNLKALTIAAKAKVKRAKVFANKEIPKRIIPPVLKLPVKAIKSVIKESKPSIKTEKAVTKTEIHSQNIAKVSSVTIEELQNQIRLSGLTSEEKYKILDARDRLMRLKQEKQKNLATAKVTKGTCPDMCPEKERYMREFQRQLGSYEQMESTEYKINHMKTIKQYSRSSADQEEPMPHDLRPLKSLKMTMSYILHEIVDLCEDENTNLTEWYHFVWDRMRSIRKDITQQELCCLETVELVEQCARFHILCSERLCAEETSVFDPKINSENLTKCLQSLKYMYLDLRENSIICKNEPEFRAYIILLNLNNGSFISELSTLSVSVQHSPEVKFALDIYSAIAMDNYCRFFKLVRTTTYLNGCILLRYFNQIRVKALSVMVKAYCRTSGSTEYPLYELIDILGFEDEDEVFEFCSRLGLKCDKESLYIKLNKENYREPSNNLEQGRAFNLVLSKRLSNNQSIGQCIAGCTLPDKSYENHKPHSSFDSQGYLLPSSINAQDQSFMDPYEFMEEDTQFLNEKKNSKTLDKFSNKAENNKQINPMANVLNTELKSNTNVPKAPIAAVRILPTTCTSLTSNTVKSNFNATSSSSAIFAKPPSTIFSTIPTKPSSIPVNSSFNLTVNKSIFSGRNSSQTNLFKQPTAPLPDLTQTNRNSEILSNPISSQKIDRLSTKRRMDESISVLEKKSLLDKDELVRKQQENEQRLKVEQEKLQRREMINKQSLKEYYKIEESVIEEMSADIIEAEFERIKLIENLSEKIYDGIFRQICEAILDEQLFIQDMLIEVERRLHDHLVMKYYRIWKQQAAKRRNHRREALDNTPVWLQCESIEECARKLYNPQQKIAIKYAREMKKQSSVIESPTDVEKSRHTPVQFIVHVGLKENANSLDIENNQQYFWKMVISWPLLENRLNLWRHKKIVNKYLSPEDYTLEPIFIQHKPSPYECLNICIRHFEGLVYENCLTGMDGLLFIAAADESPKSIERRLTKAVLSREKLMPVPLVVCIFADKEQDLNDTSVIPIVELLLESGYVSEYTLLRECSVKESDVLKAIQSAILWLAINRSPAIPLEMDYLKRVFDDCLTEDLWLRIQGHLLHKERFSEALNDPNFIINLHNEAVNHIMDIMLDPESMTYTDFAPELKIYLLNKRSYPCTYEYFDPVWKHPEYRAELERIMSSFIFPPWKHVWPINNMIDFHNSIADYCGLVVSRENGLSITDNIVSDLFLISSHDANSHTSFADVLIHLVSKKISELASNTRVVYNKNHIKHFQMLPWWFKSSILIDYVTQNKEVEMDESNESVQNTSMYKAIASTSKVDLNFTYDIEELSTIYQEQKEDDFSLSEFCQETESHTFEVINTVKKLEKQMEEQKLRNKKFETRLKKALEGDSYNDS